MRRYYKQIWLDLIVLLGRARLTVSFKRPTFVFLFLGFIFGLAFMLITPPLFNADEANHVYRAYQLSEGDLLSETTPQDLAGGKVPSGLVAVNNLASAGDLVVQPLKRFNLRNLDDQLRAIPLSPKSRSETIFPDTALYSPVPYIPEIIAIWIVRLLSSSPLYMIYAGRLFGLCASLVIFAYAIHKLPFGKWGLVAIGLLPMTVDIFSSFSADGLTIAFTALFVAMVAKFVYGRRLIGKDFDSLILLLSVVALALSKTTYVVLLPVLLAIPLAHKDGRSRKPLLVSLAFLACGIGAALVWQYATRYITTIALDPTIIPHQQFRFIATHPWWFVKTPLASMYFSNDVNGVFISFFGVFAWLTAPLPYIYIFLEVLVLTFTCTTTYASEKFKSSMSKAFLPLRRLSVLMALLGALVVSVALYAYWTPVGDKNIFGLQGRYFLPICIILLPALRIRKFIVQEKTARAWATWGSTISLIAATASLVARFYIHA